MCITAPLVPVGRLRLPHAQEHSPPTLAVSQRAADLHHSAEATHAHIPAESVAALAAENCFQDEIIDVLKVLA